MKIRGEYWIDERGHVEFADGDVGEFNHDMIATRHVVGQYSDEVVKFAQSLGIPTDDVERHGELDVEAIGNLLREIEEKLEHIQTDERNPSSYPGEWSPYDRTQLNDYIMKQIGVPDLGAYSILFGAGHASMYVMEHEQWSTVRGMNVEVFGYDDRKRQALFSGLQEILDQEGIDEDVPTADLEFALYDFKTNRSSYITLEDLEKPQVVARPQIPLQTKGDRRFARPDTTENMPMPNKTPTTALPKKKSWTTSAQKAGIIGPGQEFWRGTSEHFSFKHWLFVQESTTL